MARLRNVAGNVRPVAIVSLAAFAALLPAMILGVPAGHDLPNHLRFVLPFYESIRAGGLYPGWLAQSNGGFGDPSFRFYPPALYYVWSGARFFTGGWYSASLLTFTIVSAIGSLGVYFWSTSFLSRQLAIWAAILYAFVPYRINEFYGASLLAEYAAGAVLPCAFAFVWRVCNGKEYVRDLAGLAVCYALLILSNLPLAIIGSLALLLYGLLNIEKGKVRGRIARLGLAGALGLAASACYWVTMVTEISWITKRTLVEDASLAAYFDFRNNFIFSPFTLGNTNSWFSHTLALATLTMSLGALMMWVWPRREKFSWDLKAVVVLFLFSLFMTTELSRPLWIVIPKLREVQFPWRWLVITSIAVPLLAAASIPFWKEKVKGTKRPLVLIAIGGVLISLSYSAARIRDANYLPRFEFTSASKSIPGSRSIDYWLPVWVQSYPQPMAREVDAGDRPVSIDRWEPEHRVFQVGSGAAGEARVRAFYYPHWKATASNLVLRTQPASDGVLLISLPRGPVSIDLSFNEPVRSRVSGIISIIAWTILVLLVLWPRKLPTWKRTT